MNYISIEKLRMISNNAKLALKYFLVAIIVISAENITNIFFSFCSLPINFIVLLSAFAIGCTVLKLFTADNTFQIAVRASFLGYLFATGVYIRLMAPCNIQIFGAYMCIMAFFHFSEYFVIAIVQPKQVSTDSFVLNHSPQYVIAAIASWIEFFIESYFFPGMKQVFWLSNIGLGISVLGETLRKFSMLTAGSNFNHLIQCEKSTDHVLVTHGVYAWFRHPSYVGWFYWSIGTQVILLNPICIPAYTIASWMFFKTRIFYEEITLLNFFQESYYNYQKKVGTGIPFIKGYVK